MDLKVILSFICPMKQILLECLLMDNGEVLHYGKSLGFNPERLDASGGKFKDLEVYELPPKNNSCIACEG